MKLKNRIIIIYASLNSVPSPKGAAPSKVIYETISLLNSEKYICYSLFNNELSSFDYDKSKFKHLSPGFFDQLLLFLLKLFLPYHSRKNMFNTGDDNVLLFYIAISRKIFQSKPKGVIVHVGHGLVQMIKKFSPNLPVIYYHHGTSLHSKLTEKQWQRLDKNTVGLISVNSIAFAKANQKFSHKIPQKKLFTLHNAISPFYKREDIHRAKIQARERLKIPLDSFVIAYSGRICREKGVLNLIKAFEIVKKKCPQAELLIIGGPGTVRHIEKGKEYINTCETYCNERNLIANFTGFLRQEILMQYLASCDVVVLPTDPSLSEEGLSLSLLEALSLGKPIIATDSGGNNEIVINGHNGFLIQNKPKYYNEIATSIISLIKNKELCQKFAENSIEIFYNRFSYDIFIKNFNRIMKEMGFE